MLDYLDILAEDTIQKIKDGYYNVNFKISHSSSLKNSIQKCKKNPIISEIKFSSPSKGTIINKCNIVNLAKIMEQSGVVGISVLTEKKYFGGDIRFISDIRSKAKIKIPILMKDIILDFQQIDAASKIGANVVLLIKTLFDRGYCKESINDFIEYAHSKNLEVLVETHTNEEFQFVLKSDADLIGINNRNLATLKVDFEITKKILKNNTAEDKIIISESGIKKTSDIQLLKSYGANAFLVGTSIMTAKNIEEKIKKMVEVI
jgi:indole-3-glycerol phosphate synthase